MCRKIKIYLVFDEKEKHMKKIITALIAVIMLITSVFTVYAQDDDVDKYRIDVNCEQNIVIVYRKNNDNSYEPYKAFVCSVGTDTPHGTFQISEKYEWRNLFGNVWGQYATRITGHILFHSVPYFTPNKDDLEYEEYNKLGTVASMGCIRLTVKDVKWIYDNCPEGTVVRMYASSKKEPLEKPIPINIDVDNEELRGWDPTDPDENNPWKDVFNSDNIDDEKDDSGQYIFSVAGNQLLLKKTNNLIYIMKISKYKQESFGIRSIKPVEQAETFELYGRVLVHVKNIDDDENVKCNLTEISELAGFSPYGEKTMFIY